ncbi:hypothetical protein [Paraliomyxa miuraensis]|uniref:hypothetical protein n=1 Tax=Paraliomyxa miuraensis TaxID=376150 RepID=UPI0022515AC2|nr:hypothetical protein [Paraliomyxa miuraensis]MCX4243121.1 hypothetical protein [Paraliomyxa miuraensis]
MSTSPKLLSRLVLGIAVFGPAAAIASCDTSGITTNPGSIVQAAASCPDVSSVSAIMKIDFAKEFGIDAAMAGTVKAGTQAAVELQGFAASVDAKLVTACGNLARDLGKGGEFADGPTACKAAMDAMAEVKAKLGGSAKIALSMEPPRCRASMDAMAQCVAECDASVEPGSVQVECEKGKLSGTCEAQCSGRCDLAAAAKCDGTCQGSCSAKFSGSCGGQCVGTCDGKKVNGASCAGKCEGSCSALAEGSCGGQCDGSCQMKAAGQCNGTCTGECSAEMKAPSCEGEMQPPKASAECNAACDAHVQAEVKCEPAKVALIVEGSADAQLAATYRAAIERNLPAVLEISVGMKDQALHAAANVKAVVEGVQATVKAFKGAPEIAARLSACVGVPFKAAFDAAASLKANVDVSVQVQASVSASASGSASGSAGG